VGLHKHMNNSIPLGNNFIDASNEIIAQELLKEPQTLINVQCSQSVALYYWVATAWQTFYESQEWKGK
jgi:hypothetical protein